MIWILLGITALAGLFGQYTLASSLGASHLKIIVSSDNIMGLVVSLMSGLLFFQEYRLFTFYTFSVFSSGIALSIGGLGLLMLGGGGGGTATPTSK